MPETSGKGVDPKTGRPYENEYKGKDAGKTPTGVAPADQTKAIAPAKSGRGMQPGESVSAWRQRLRDMDGQNTAQQEALTK